MDAATKLKMIVTQQDNVGRKSRIQRIIEKVNIDKKKDYDLIKRFGHRSSKEIHRAHKSPKTLTEPYLQTPSPEIDQTNYSDKVMPKRFFESKYGSLKQRVLQSEDK